MTQTRLDQLEQNYDVVICGGGLAGLTLARQLRRTYPDMRLLVAERHARPLPLAGHKVGESSVELASQYFESLGLRDYLLENQLIKHGLRFFPGGGDMPLDKRTEIGPAQEPIVNSYQLDRGLLENDLRQMVIDDGVTLVEGVNVKDVALRPGEEPHTVELERKADGDEEHAQVSCRWVVDAAGRSALLRRQMKLTRGSPHVANAGWFRIKGKLDITHMVPPESTRWHQVPDAEHRWRSTNHLMGEGYWAWIIPLSSGNTSIGVVVHDSVHEFDKVRTLERTQEFIERYEPALARALDGFEIIDFRCLKGYSHNVARSWSADRWAIVGEAGAFVDPFYSPGSDHIACANTFTCELIRVDRAGEDLDQRARELNMIYRSLIGGNIDIYKDAAKVYGHPSAMLAKVYWDNFAYWSYPCQFFLQGLYRLTGHELDGVSQVGQRFIQLSRYIQTLLGAWAAMGEERPKEAFYPMPLFPSVAVDAHLALQNRWSAEETLEYMKKRVNEGAEMVGEILVQALCRVGESRMDELFAAAGAARWEDIPIYESRLDAADSIGLARRKALRPLTRDVERTLGKMQSPAPKEALRRVLRPLLRHDKTSSEQMQATA